MIQCQRGRKKVQIPTNRRSAGYVEYIKVEKGCDVADPSKIKLLSIPDNWKPKKSNNTLKEQPFAKVDNPGECPEYCYTPKFDGKGKGRKYIHHSLPTVTMPVTTKVKSKSRKVDDLKFYYDGQKTVSSAVLSRHGANTTDLFLEERHGILDGEKLKRMGLTANKVKNDVGLLDALFFHQILLPICDTKNKELKMMEGSTSMMISKYSLRYIKLAIKQVQHRDMNHLFRQWMSLLNLMAW